MAIKCAELCLVITAIYVPFVLRLTQTPSHEEISIRLCLNVALVRKAQSVMK